jgi:hypothetical protein
MKKNEYHYIPDTSKVVKVKSGRFTITPVDPKGTLNSLGPFRKTSQVFLENGMPVVSNGPYDMTIDTSANTPKKSRFRVTNVYPADTPSGYIKSRFAVTNVFPPKTLSIPIPEEMQDIPKKSRFRVTNVYPADTPSGYKKSRFAVTNVFPPKTMNNREKNKNETKYHSLPKGSKITKIENGRLTIRPVSPRRSLSGPVSKKSTVTYKTGRITVKRRPVGTRALSVGGSTSSKRRSQTSKRRSKRYKRIRIV